MMNDDINMMNDDINMKYDDINPIPAGVLENQDMLG